jgi:ATP-binding protein involved in chromosome partitioning
MSDHLRERIENAVKEFEDPLLGADLDRLRALRELHVDGSRVTVDLRFGYPVERHGRALAAALKRLLETLPGVDQAEIRIASKIVAHAVAPNVARLPAIKNVIAVASAKGGVGKSTVAANLALALAAEGARVGVLDADIYGPSQPRMLGVEGRTGSSDGKHFEPMESHGVQSISIGHMIDPEQPMIWRGPMVTKALRELLGQTRWGELDYLIVDMPPGTGDIQLTLAQKVPVAGAVIVTTPQDIATLDARRGLKMFQKVNIPVLGIVENMSLHVCSHCGHEEHVFGEGGGDRVAKDYDVPLLGTLPLDIRIREHADGGRPSVVADPEGDAARRFTEIALRMASALALRPKDYARKMPKIVVE